MVPRQSLLTELLGRARLRSGTCIRACPNRTTLEAGTGYDSRRIYSSARIPRLDSHSHPRLHHLKLSSFHSHHYNHNPVFSAKCLSTTSGKQTRDTNTMTKGVDFYDLKAELPGADKYYSFDQLKGKVVLIVNTASKWCASYPYLTVDTH